LLVNNIKRDFYGTIVWWKCRQVKRIGFTIRPLLLCQRYFSVYFKEAAKCKISFLKYPSKRVLFEPASMKSVVHCSFENQYSIYVFGPNKLAIKVIFRINVVAGNITCSIHSKGAGGRKHNRCLTRHFDRDIPIFRAP